MKDILLRYEPFECYEDGEFDEKDFDLYLKAEPAIKIVEAIVIEPFDEKLKALDRDEWTFGNLKLKKSHRRQEHTKWKEIYNKLDIFLEIRADDSRAKQLQGLKHFDGLGYCIAIPHILSEFGKMKEQFTSISEYDQIEWPKPRKDEPTRSISIPNRSYRQITEENAKIALACRRFRSSIQKEVIEAYKMANKIWLARQTGWSEEKIPPADASPVERTRLIGENYIFMQLIREEIPKYKDILKSFIDELQNQNGQYRFKEEKGILYVNIKNLRERLQTLYNKKIEIESRYVIVP